MQTEVVIDRIAAGGDGLGREPDGRIVFVPRTAPGELVQAAITEEHAKWARALPRGVLRPSPDRRDPPCPYYRRCGGCQLQHLGYEAQLRAKGQIVADALNRLGGFSVDPPPVKPSPKRLEYRNRVTFTLLRAHDRVVAGYRTFDDPEEILDVEDCPLAEPAINRAWQEIRESWGGVWAERLPEGEELRLTLRSTESGQVGVVIQGGDGPGQLQTILERAGSVSAIWRLDGDGEIVAHAGASHLDDRWGPYCLPLTVDTFVQVNRYLARHLEQHVLGASQSIAGRRIIDAYCGYGLRTLELARAGAEVVGIDADDRAIAAAREAATGEGLTAAFRPARVEDVLSSELPAHTLILNPPRRGVSRDVIRCVLDGSVSRLIYVSCDPATLARDLKELSEKYALLDCAAFDMFPQTAQVETVATLESAPRPTAPAPEGQGPR